MADSHRHLVDELVRVGSSFIVFKGRSIQEETWFVGTRSDRCRRKGNGWLIEERMIVLDHNAVPTITVFF
jgi:3-phenylpropionate/cinnamic acid dioxygenase small subunit